MPLAYKQCTKCGCLYEDGDIETAFRLNYSARYTSQSYRRPICIVCEQKERDAKKDARRHRKKARSCIITHYRKYKRQGFVGSKQDFIERYGYDLDVMERDLKRAEAQVNCPDCGHPYRVLPDDITLDIREPNEPPVYGENTAWVCRTCNVSKGTLTMEQWEAKKRIFHFQGQFVKSLEQDPFTGLPLFDCVGAQEQPSE